MTQQEHHLRALLVGFVVGLFFIAIIYASKWANQSGCGEHEPKDGLPVWCRR